MPETEREKLRHQLDSLEQRIEARLRALDARGEVAHLRDQLTELAKRQRKLRHRVEGAQDAEWNSSRDELEREHSLLHELLVDYEKKLDRDEMKEPPPGRAPGAKSGLV